MKRRTFLTAVAGTALLAACGNDSEAASGGSGKVTLGFSAWPGWFPWQVADERGFFADNDVQVTVRYFDSYTDSLNALATGNLTCNSQTLNDTLSSVSGGAAQTIVLVNDNSTGNDQIIAAPGITSVADLRGRTVAAEEGTVDHYLLLLALQEAGLTQEDIEFTPLLTDAAAAAFVAGQVDAVGVFAPFTTTALAREGSAAISTSADFPGAIPDTLAFQSDFVAAYPDQVQAIVQTWFDTLAWIEANPAEAVSIMAARGSVSEVEYAEYDTGTTIFTKEQNVAAFEPGSDATHLDFQAGRIAEFLVGTGLVETEPPLDGLFDATFVRAAT